MRKSFQKISIGLIILFLLTPMFKPPLPVQAANDPSLNFSVTPSSSELTLNSDSVAEGTLTINVTPEGTVGQKQREPIDVAFVYDTSGSMDDFLDWKKKAKSAKEALASALDYFGQKDNQVAGDNFYFIPFNDNVRTSGQVKVVEGLGQIEGLLNKLEYNNIGGTNYTQTLEYTKNRLNQSNNKNKYIIFLTDGEPTVLNYDRNTYILYTNGTALYNGWTSKNNYEKTRNLIHRVAEETSRDLAASNITMYSIGFAKEDEIDFQLLERMSAVTGGTAVRATTSNLTTIFQEISKRIDSYTINGEVTVDLQKYSGDVEIDPSSTAIVDENQVAHFPFKFTFPVGSAPDPSNVVASLPLIFKKAGTYSFDNINLNYDGLSAPKTHAPVTIKVNKDMNSVPGAIFEVKPSSEEFIKPPNDHAKGNIDITITPKGMAPRDERLPIDVVFVHDTSGSMAESFEGTRRDTTAKNALQSAINYFETNSKVDDKFYFVPFDGEVSDKKIYEHGLFSKRLIGVVAPTVGLSSIKETIKLLDYSKDYLLFTESTSMGGTNYNAALNEATNKFVLGSNRNKYIIFLTDGEPTTLTYNNDKYEIYTNNTAAKNGNRIPLEDAKNIIHEQALNISDSLGSKGITMYSIGFAQEGEVDFELLRNMSAKTGGYAVQGKTDNLTTIFDDMSKKVNATSISGNVSIDLKKFDGDVIVDPSSNFKANSQQVVQIPFNITFPAGELPDPRIIQQSLPLQFKKSGPYEFAENVVMSYTDHNGSQKTIEHDPFTVVVGEETAPHFLNEVDILGNQYYSPDSLVKLGSTDSERNEFIVEYKLWPETVFTEITNGNISNLKITQPLFDGISLANHDQITLYKNGERAEGITVNPINNGSDIEIELKNNDITYASGNFSVDEYVIQLRLKADWALPYRLLPQANLHFYDSRFMEQNQSLNIDEQHISMRVHLKGMNYTYTGNHQGMIEKVHSQDGTVVAKTQLPADDGLIEKPVREMRLINDGKAIEVTYFDQTKAVLHLKTDYRLKNLSLSEELQSGDTTKGRVGFKIIDFIAGENVVYEYQLKVNGSETEWQAFDPTGTIELPKDLEGEVEILVRTKGGFSLNEEPIVKTLTIIKESISVEPNPIELNVGQSIPVEVKITPDDDTERDFVITTLDPGIAEYEDGKVTGVNAGETVLQVTTTDIAGNEMTEHITIKVNPVLITSITVTPNPLNIGKLHEYKDFIIAIEPKNATNQELIWESLHPYVVGIVQPGRIYGKTTGTAEIEIKANDGSGVSTTILVHVGSPLTGLDVDDLLVIEKGDTEKNMNDYFDYLPSDATNIKGDPSFTSKNEDILEVDPGGELIPKRLGETEVEISVQDEDDNTFTADLKVKVVEKGLTDSYDKDKY